MAIMTSGAPTAQATSSELVGGVDLLLLALLPCCNTVLLQLYYFMQSLSCRAAPAAEPHPESAPDC
jgi:hypothetical protein